MPFLTAGSHRLEFKLTRSGDDRPVLVFLHEGLGSIAAWRDFPARCSDTAGCSRLVYSRYGYGNSDPLAEPRSVDYLHEEALQVLPELLGELEIENPILFGHSDGASIALIHAGLAGRPLAGVIALAPHVFVEPKAIEGVARIRRLWETTPLREKLACFHAHADSAFFGWHDIWTSESFRSWNVENCLGGITCPLLAIQGEQDEYGTMEQLDRIARRVSHTRQLRLDCCGHSPHRDQPEAVIAATAEFVASLTDTIARKSIQTAL